MLHRMRRLVAPTDAETEQSHPILLEWVQGTKP
jgi:hypothetical protein